MIILLKKIAKLFIYTFLIINVFISTSANVFSENISENNSRYVFSMLLLFLFYNRKYFLKIPILILNKLFKKA